MLIFQLFNFKVFAKNTFHVTGNITRFCLFLQPCCENKKDDEDMLKQMRSLYAKSNKVIRMFNHCTVDVKLLLIESYCTSFYCGYLWSDYKAKTFSKLRVAFNNVYRKVLGLPTWSSASEMYATHNIENFEALLRKVIYGFIQRLEDSSNVIVQTLTES